jgi:uracil-DNA glycosylase family 4
MIGIIDQMTAKPQGCSKCPLFNAKLVSGAGVRPASVLFLGSNPPSWGGLFTDNGGKILKHIISKLKAENPEDKSVLDMSAKSYMMYSACCPGKAVNEVIDTCKANVSGQMLSMADPKVIVALGREACHFLGIQGNITDVRGTVHEVTLGNKKYKAIPTLPLATLDASPGLFDIVKNDILKAAKAADNSRLDDIDVPSLMASYAIPYKLEEAIAVLEEYCNYSAPGKAIENTMMALDFETTTLYPWNRKGRIIAISGSVGPGKAFSVLVDHRDSKYKFKEIAPYVIKLLQSKHPKAWWNYKYDYSMARFCLIDRIQDLINSDPSYTKVLESVIGRPFEDIKRNGPINNSRWDGMLGEHMLHEDKKGFYSLKEVVVEHFPSLVGYEDKLTTLFNDKLSAAKQNAINSAFEVQLHNCLGNKVIDDRRIVLDDLPEEIEEIAAYIKAKVSLLKKQVKNKKNTTEVKNNIEALISVYSNIGDSYKEEIAYTKAALSSLHTAIVSKGIDPTKEIVTYEDIDIAVMLPYAAIDADLTWRISTLQRAKAIKEDPIKKAESESRPAMITLMDLHYIPLTEVLAEMQVEGVRVNTKFLKDAREVLDAKAAELEEKILNLVKSDLGRDIEVSDINSSQAMADLMVAGYGLPKYKETESGAVSTDRDTMSKYSDLGNLVAKNVLEYRDVAKARSTYVEAFLELSEFDGRIHGAIHLNGTATGRASSSNPNLQNITASIAGFNIKEAFIPTDTSFTNGYESRLCEKYNWTKDEELVMVDIDFSGAEIRGLTAYVKDSALINALEKNLDIHSWIASVIFSEDYDTINKLRKTDDRYNQMRQKAKTIVFGLIYGISNVGLADRLAITTEEADSLMFTFFTRFPKIAEYIESTKTKITKECILRTPTGRARRFPMVQMGGQFQSRNHRQGINYLVQSFCAEIVLRVINNLRKNIHSIRGRLVLTVHDSIVMEIPESNISMLKEFLFQNVDLFIKQNFKELPVNMPYDIKIGKSYGGAE